MSDLKDLAWQAQSQSPAPELDHLIARSRARLRRRRILAVAAAVTAVAVPTAVVATQLPGGQEGQAAAETGRPTGRQIAHGRDSVLMQYFPLPGNRWIANWERCPTPGDLTNCWSVLAWKSGNGVEFGEPTWAWRGAGLVQVGKDVYGVRNVSQDGKVRRLIVFQDGRPVEQPLVVSGTTSTIGDGVILDTRSGQQIVVDPRTGRAKNLQLPADLRQQYYPKRDEGGRWWVVKAGSLASTTDGRTWTRRTLRPGSAPQLKVSPNGRTILAQYAPAPGSNQVGGDILRSRDGGQTWQPLSDPLQRLFEWVAVYDDGSALARDTGGDGRVTAMYRVGPDGSFGREPQSEYSLKNVAVLGDQVSGIGFGKAITDERQLPTATPTPLPPPEPPVQEVMVSNDRGVTWDTFEPR